MPVGLFTVDQFRELNVGDIVGNRESRIACLLCGGVRGVVLISVRSYSPTRAWIGESADQGRAGIIVGGGKRRWDMRGSRFVWAVVSAMVDD